MLDWEGISLVELCNTLKHQVYPNTVNNPHIGISKILKRHHQKAHIQITQTAKDYLKAELDRLFEQNGYDEYFGVAEPPVRSVLSRCHGQNEPPCC